MKRRAPRGKAALLVPALALAPSAASAAEAAGIDGRDLAIWWVVPFAGLLLSIATMPLLLPHFWHRHFGKVSLAWTLGFVVPFAVLHGAAPALREVLHTLLLDFLPFVILLTALFTVAGGIRLTGAIRGTPGVNTLLLLIGTAVASLMGTTGAAMLVLRPLIRANRNRRHNTHVFVFFIFLVANIGGALSPLGDPPLFLGFLKGVPFFWPTWHLLAPTSLCVVLLLFVFYGLDSRLHRRGWIEDPSPIEEIERLGIDGKPNLALLVLIVAVVFLSGVWADTGAVALAGIHLPLAGLATNLLLLGITAASLRLTTAQNRRANEFSWAAMLEVGKLFAGIFVTLVPAIAILRAGPEGALAPLVALTAAQGRPLDAVYFWLTGGLSSFLDNAPTYLVFFNLAGGDPQALTGPLARTLAAISAGAVFMGANSYIGNAPNFMVKAICEERGIRMPSFFGYMAWSGLILLPLFALVSWLFFT